MIHRLDQNDFEKKFKVRFKTFFMYLNHFSANELKTSLDDLEEELEKTTVKNKKLMSKRKTKAEKHE